MKNQALSIASASFGRYVPPFSAGRTIGGADNPLLGEVTVFGRLLPAPIPRVFAIGSFELAALTVTP